MCGSGVCMPQQILWDTVNEQAVRIPLECILVLEWGCIPLLNDSIVFNENRITSIITELSQH